MEGHRALNPEDNLEETTQNWNSADEELHPSVMRKDTTCQFCERKGHWTLECRLMKKYRRMYELEHTEENPVTSDQDISDQDPKMVPTPNTIWSPLPTKF